MELRADWHARVTGLRREGAPPSWRLGDGIARGAELLELAGDDFGDVEYGPSTTPGLRSAYDLREAARR